MKRKMMDFLSIISLAYLLLLIFLFLNQRNIMYHPDTQKPGPVAYGFALENVVAYPTPDGLTLTGLYFSGISDKPVILYFQGNAGHSGDRVSKVRHFIKQGYGVLLAGYRGYGGNPGKPSEQGFYQDAHGAINFLKSKGYRENRIVLYGESIGSGVGTQMATEGMFLGLVLEAPFTSIVDIAKNRYFFVPVSLLLKDRFDNVSKISAINVPLLIIHGTNDKTVSIESGHQLAAAAIPPKRFVSITGAGHGNLYDFGAAHHVLEFLGKIKSTTGTQTR